MSHSRTERSVIEKSVSIPAHVASITVNDVRRLPKVVMMNLRHIDAAAPRREFVTSEVEVASDNQNMAVKKSPFGNLHFLMYVAE